MSELDENKDGRASRPEIERAFDIDKEEAQKNLFKLQDRRTEIMEKGKSESAKGSESKTEKADDKDDEKDKDDKDKDKDM